MAETLDQIFVIGKGWLVASLTALLPPGWQEPAAVALSTVITVASMLSVFLLMFGITTVLERKGLGRIQNRYGPNRVGPWGFFQFMADGIKALTKEDIVPRSADRWVHFLAPIVLLVCVIATLAVLPVGRNMVPVDLDAGILFFFAAGAASELTVFMAGWASRNKYSLMGAMRGIAQMISYEVPLILSAVPAVMIVGSLSTVRMVEAQAEIVGGWAQWHVFTPWGLVGLLLFLISATAEMNRSPFDLPEAESELVAGYFTEYSGFKFAMFFIAEYLGMLAMSALAVTLFLGGWSAPFAFLEWVPSWLLFFGKLSMLIALFIWVRGTVPRLRMDQLMNFAWKFLLPMALINIGVAGAWHYLAPGLGRWLATAGVLAMAYYALSRSFSLRSPKRVYRYAD